MSSFKKRFLRALMVFSRSQFNGFFWLLSIQPMEIKLQLFTV